jgi:hypothetical protein
MKTFFASFSLLLIACGGDPLDPGAGDEHGTGTNTLLLEGGAYAEPRIANTREALDFDTEFSVRIFLNDQAVTTGTVTVTSRFESIDLTLDQDQRWVGRAAGYDEVYQLDVISGADEVRGVIVDGPDLHVITAPAAGASLDSTVANMLEWDRDEQADVITFKADEIDRITISDTGTYSIPPGSLKAEKDNSRTNTLELRRTNHVVPAGALGGSHFSVSVEQQLEVVALPNPAL